MFKVMIVDNETIIRKGLSQCIDWADMDCEVTASAADGLDALQKLTKAPVDIVISDIRMPGMDGLSLAREIQQAYPHTKVIILTGFSEFEYAQTAVRYRVADFLLKPVSEEKLRVAVTRAISLLQSDKDAQQLERSLAEREADNRRLQQTLFIQNLLESDNLSALFVLEQSHRLLLDFSACHVLNFGLNLPDDTPPERASACADNATRFLQRAFDMHGVYVIPRGENGFLMVALGTREDTLRQELNEYVALIDSMTEYSMQIGISRAVNNAMTIQAAAKEAADARRYMALDDGHSYIFYSDIPALSEAGQEKLLALLRRAESALQNQNLSAFRQVMREFERVVRADHIAFSEVRNFILIVYNMCVRTLLNYSMDAFLASNRMMSAENLLAALSPRCMTDGIIRVADQTINTLKGSMTEPEDLMRFICGYIQAHYAQDISLESLASVAHLSASYLSRLFKKHTGENISNYIQNTRMEKAREMLRSTTMKTYEIARAVGIDDPVYFSRLFKKTTGLKPTDYRKDE